MGLNIVAGKAKTGKSSYIYDDIKRNLNDNKNENLILIVPEQMTYQAEYELIEHLKDFGILGVEVLSFKRLAYKVFEEVGGLKIQEINNYGKIMLLKKIFEEAIPELQVFKKASKQEGFLREFEGLIKELKQNSVSVEFIENVNKYKINNELLKRKLSDIIKIYKFYDEEDKIDLFISSIEHSNFIKNSKIYIDGFDSFNGQRYKLIEKLITYSKEVSLSLNMDKENLYDLTKTDDWEAFKIIHDTYLNIKDILNESGNELQIVSVNNNCLNDEIKALEKNILAVNVDSYKEKSENITIYSSMNPYTETEKVAAKIISLIRDKGYRWKDIAIAVSDMDNYSINIKKIFTQYEIPYFLDIKRDIMDNPFTKYILSILDMFIWNFKHNSVFEYLKSGFSPLDYNEVMKLENFALQYGIEGYKWFKEFKFKANDIEYYNDLRVKFVNDFDKKRKDFKKLKNAQDITLFIFDFIEKHKTQDKIGKQVEVFKQNRLYEKSTENAQVWNYVIDIFDQIILAGSDVALSPLEYRKMIEAGFREVLIGIIPPTIDKVQIGSVERIALSNHKTLFILGANEGKLGSNSSEKGLLLDDERDVLLENGMKLSNSSNKTTYKEKHMIYKLFSSPSEKLYVSYALGTVEGRTLQPSLYVDRVKEIFSTLIEESDLSDIDEIDKVSCKKGTVSQVVSSIRDFTEGKNINPIWKDVYSWYEKNDEQTCYLIEKGLNFSNKAEKINTEMIDKIYQMPMNMTVSKLENFAQCPFKFFMENVLKPQPRIVQKIEFYDLGNIYHAAVEKFTNEISLNKFDINNLNKDDVYKLAENCTDKVLQEKEQEITALDANERNKYMKNKIRRLVNRAAYTIIEQLKRGSFRPKFTELKIGGTNEEITNAIEPIELKLSDDTSIYLQGRIDRVDLYKKDDKAYVNIIDYKSSNKDVDLSDAVEGLQLQLLVYLSSVIKSGEKLINSTPEIGGAYYFLIDDPLIDGDNLSGDVEDEIFSKMSLKGYVAEDIEVISNMDNKLEETKSSDIISVGFNKDGSIKKTSKTLMNDEYKAVLNKTDEVTKKIAEEIISGKIEIMPYKKETGQTPCVYCDYNAVCQFDSAIEGNKYRKIKKMSKDDILFSIKKESEDENESDIENEEVK
ncbi:MAG: addB [Bacillota bacterium]|nr:addB [Bacillota bacterium]